MARSHGSSFERVFQGENQGWADRDDPYATAKATAAQDELGFGGSERTGKSKDQIPGSFAALKDDDVRQATASATADPCGMTNKRGRQRQRRDRSTALLTLCRERLRSGWHGGWWDKRAGKSAPSTRLRRGSCWGDRILFKMLEVIANVQEYQDPIQFRSARYG
jgi:hypothetical protein